jgi:broad specificity phosphatase PhoE
MTPEQISPARRRIYLMRHGSVSYFDANGRHPDPDNVSLNELGRSQATAAGLSFARISARFDRVIVSGLTRTVETAERVLAETRQRAALEVWPQLREIKGGPLEAIETAQLRDAVVGVFEGVVPHERRFAGGESIGELLDRVHPAIAKLRADPDWDCILMVLHGGVNRAILSLALTGQRLFFGGLSQAPACINALDVGEAPLDWVVRYVGLAPSDLLQAESRRSTLESMLIEYMKTRASDESRCALGGQTDHV